MKINNNRKSGFTLVEIMIVVAIIGLLAAIAIPNFVKARENSQVNTCIANMKQIEGAKATWALEEKKTSAATPGITDLCGVGKYIQREPFCPLSANGAPPYAPTAVDAVETCPNFNISNKHKL